MEVVAEEHSQRLEALAEGVEVGEGMPYSEASKKCQGITRLT